MGSPKSRTSKSKSSSVSTSSSPTRRHKKVRFSSHERQTYVYSPVEVERDEYLVALEKASKCPVDRKGMPRPIKYPCKFRNTLFTDNSDYQKYVIFMRIARSGVIPNSLKK